MNQLFDRFMKTYLIRPGKKVDKTEAFYPLIRKDIPQEIKSIIGSEYLVTGSVGRGVRTAYPWVGIFNPEITKSAQHGLYVVYLFKKDMSGFYLSLNQGITYFKDRFKKESYDKAIQMAEHFRGIIGETRFSKTGIDLGSEKRDLGYGYQCTNIVSKYYHFEDYSDQELRDDLRDMMKLYERVYKVFAPIPYDRYIEMVINDEAFDLVEADEADKIINQNILRASGKDEVKIRTVELVERQPRVIRPTTVSREGVIRKQDYLKRAEEDQRTGILGEQLVIDYEKNRLNKLGRPDLAQKIRWVAKESDAYGFDIKSFDIDDSGQFVEIVIEVKTTKLRYDAPFYVTENELETSKTYGDLYRVYRIIDIESERPQMYIKAGSIDKNFVLKPKAYVAV